MASLVCCSPRNSFLNYARKNAYWGWTRKPNKTRFCAYADIRHAATTYFFSNKCYLSRAFQDISQKSHFICTWNSGKWTRVDFRKEGKKCRRQKSKLSIFEPEAKIKLDSGESEKRTNKVSGRIGKTVVLYVNSEFPTLSVFSCGWPKTGSSWIFASDQ